MRKIKLALLHLLPIAGEIEYNQNLIEKAVKQAASYDVDWIVTPELAVSGLQFNCVIGTDWIEEQPNKWMKSFSELVKSVGANVLLGCPEKGSQGKYYNSVFVINKEGQLIGKQRKFASVTDDWSAPGEVFEPVNLEGVKVGILICADAYTKEIADTFKEKGAQILVAPSSWGPGLDGPNGEWEQRSMDTQLPIFVCNRTGEDATVSFWEAQSSVIQNGKRLLSHKSKDSAILMFEWDMENLELLSQNFDVKHVI